LPPGVIRLIAQLSPRAAVYILMKKVLMAFLGLVLLSQVIKLWEHEHQAASIKPPVPPGIYQSHPGHGARLETC